MVPVGDQDMQNLPLFLSVMTDYLAGTFVGRLWLPICGVAALAYGFHVSVSYFFS